MGHLRPARIPCGRCEIQTKSTIPAVNSRALSRPFYAPSVPQSHGLFETCRETTVFRSGTIAEPIRHAAHPRFADAGDLQSTPE